MHTRCALGGGGDDGRQRLRLRWQILGVILAIVIFSPRAPARAATLAEGFWSPLPTARAPSPRYAQITVWTGHDMLIWGGGVQYHAYNDGALYNPKTHTWRPMATTSAPVHHSQPVVAWTGTELLIWGGEGCIPEPCTSGARYNPTTNTWRPMASADAPKGSVDATGVWTGKELLVWGGGGAVTTPRGSAYQVRGDGAAYNPVTDTWRPLSQIGAPTPRWGHVAVWTGRQMLIWGGLSGYSKGLTDGAAYDPATNTWSALPSAGAPSSRLGETAVWTGTEMIIWGGRHNLHTVNDGAAYNPAIHTWQTLSAAGAPARREDQTAVWTGTEMIIWGGMTTKGSFGDPQGYYGDGAAYDPATNIWTPLPASGAPTPRAYHTAVWTGQQMLVWGGFIKRNRDYLLPFGDGAAYTPPPAFPMPLALAKTGGGGMATQRPLSLFAGLLLGLTSGHPALARALSAASSPDFAGDAHPVLPLSHCPPLLPPDMQEPFGPNTRGLTAANFFIDECWEGTLDGAAFVVDLYSGNGGGVAVRYNGRLVAHTMTGGAMPIVNRFTGNYVCWMTQAWAWYGAVNIRTGALMPEQLAQYICPPASLLRHSTLPSPYAYVLGLGSARYRVGERVQSLSYPEEVVLAFLAAFQRQPSGQAALPYLSPQLQAAVRAGHPLTAILGIPQTYQVYCVSTYGPAGTGMRRNVILVTFIEAQGSLLRNFLLTVDPTNGVWTITSTSATSQGPPLTMAHQDTCQSQPTAVLHQPALPRTGDGGTARSIPSGIPPVLLTLALGLGLGLQWSAAKR